MDRFGRVRVSVLVDVTVIALDTLLVGVELSNVMVVVGLSDASPALVVGASAAEVPAMVAVGDVVVVGTPGMIALTGGCDDPGVVCSRLAITVVPLLTGIVRKMTTICFLKV